MPGRGQRLAQRRAARGAAALLLAQTDLPEPAATAEADAILAAFEQHGATEAMAATDATESEALFAARRMAYPALEQLGMGMLTEDVCVPRPRMAEMLARIEDIGRRRGVRIATVAHAGDGNLHPLMLTRTTTRTPGTAPAPRSTRSSTRPSSWAGRSPGSTASACSSATAWNASWAPGCWPCSAR